MNELLITLKEELQDISAAIKLSSNPAYKQSIDPAVLDKWVGMEITLKSVIKRMTPLVEQQPQH